MHKTVRRVQTVRMNHRPWELRRQVLWLQTVTALVLIAMVWITMIARRSTAARSLR